MKVDGFLNSFQKIASDIYEGGKIIKDASFVCLRAAGILSFRPTGDILKDNFLARGYETYRSFQIVIYSITSIVGILLLIALPFVIHQICFRK